MSMSTPAIAGKPPSSSFTPKDLYNLQLLSHLHHRQSEPAQPPSNIIEQLQLEEDAK